MSERGPSPRGWVRPLLLAIGIAVVVVVLFTWVFPWLTDMGLSPTMEQ